MQFEKLVRMALMRSFEQAGATPFLPVYAAEGSAHVETRVDMVDGFGLTFQGGGFIFPPNRPVDGSFYAGQGQVADEGLRSVMKAGGFLHSFIFMAGSDRQYISGTNDWLTIIDPKRAPIRVVMSFSALANTFDLSLLEGEGVDIVNNLMLDAAV